MLSTTAAVPGLPPGVRSRAAGWVWFGLFLSGAAIVASWPIAIPARAPGPTEARARSFGHPETAATITFLVAIYTFADEAQSGGHESEAWLDLTLELDPHFQEARAIAAPLRSVLRRGEGR